MCMVPVAVPTVSITTCSAPPAGFSSVVGMVQAVTRGLLAPGVVEKGYEWGCNSLVTTHTRTGSSWLYTVEGLLRIYYCDNGCVN